MVAVWYVLNISIHAPARGATQLYVILSIIIHRFQSTLPRGERQTSGASIQHFWNFNPRSREGSDVVLNGTFGTNNHFNPRSREGSDDEWQGRVFKIDDFNPRSREGSDLFAQLFLLLGGLFQSTLPRGERQYLAPARFCFAIFQSTLPRGERLHLLTFFRLQYGYILFHLTNKYSFCF